MYRCRVCGKLDRKGRLVGHLLKRHVSLDQVPFSCSLCNFRCTAPADLLQHITRYQRHVEEVQRTGLVDLKAVLQKSENPVNVEVLMEVEEYIEAPADDNDNGIFDLQETDEPDLPHWLTETSKELSQQGAPWNQPAIMQPVQQKMMARPLPAMTPVLPAAPASVPYNLSISTPGASADAGTFTPTVRRTATSTSTELRPMMTPRRSVTSAAAPTTTTHNNSNGEVTKQPAIPTGLWAPSTDELLKTPMFTATVLRQNQLIDTPLQDEPGYLLDGLLGTDTNDPLLNEEEEIEQVAEQPEVKEPSPAKVRKTEQEMNESKQHTVEVVNAITRAQEGLKEAISENTRALRSILNVLQTLASEQRTMRQCLDVMKHEGRQRTTIEKYEPRGPSRGDKRAEKKHDGGERSKRS